MSKQKSDLFDDEVTTGATLDSGTTIGGNQVFHLGNDGQGSGLDAETVDGSEPVHKGKGYSKSTIETEIIIETFTSPSSGSGDIDFEEDGQGQFWFSEPFSGKVYKFDQSGTILTIIDNQYSDADGLAVDSSNSLWLTNATGSFDPSSIYQISRLGDKVSGFEAPREFGRGLAIDNNQCIWHTSNEEPNSIYKMNQNGSVKDKFTSPCQFVSIGVALDSNGCIYHTNDAMYKLNQSGTVERRYSTSASNLQYSGVDENDSVWYTDFDGPEHIYKTNPLKELVTLNEV